MDRTNYNHGYSAGFAKQPVLNPHARPKDWLHGYHDGRYVRWERDHQANARFLTLMIFLGITALCVWGIDIF